MTQLAEAVLSMGYLGLALIFVILALSAIVMIARSRSTEEEETPRGHDLARRRFEVSVRREDSV
ncbi:MAG TPA: hypothetical protein VGM82_23325 [Gemmatimonadaceae bacterium]